MMDYEKSYEQLMAEAKVEYNQWLKDTKKKWYASKKKGQDIMKARAATARLKVKKS